MSLPVALQLYSLRDVIGRSGDYNQVIRQVAEMGYDGVEPAGFRTTTPEAAGQLFAELGLAVPSAHVFPPPTALTIRETAETLAAVGSRRIVSGFGPEDYATPDAIRRSCDVLNASAAAAAAHGLSFAVHNHWWEYQPVAGRFPYQLLAEQLDPAIQFEVDTYWVQTAGLDPATVIKELGSRASLLHVKDGPAIKEAPMTAVGDGVVDIPAILDAAEGNAEWLIVEIDRSDTDMLEAVRRSVQYLRSVVEA